MEQQNKEVVKKPSALSQIHTIAKGVREKHPKYQYKKCLEVATKQYNKNKKAAMKKPPAEK